MKMEEMMMYNRKRYPRNAEGTTNPEQQRHVHEFEGSVKFAEQGEDRHSHRTAGVTGEAISAGQGKHVHNISVNTDFTDHYHEIRVTTGTDIPIPGTGKHTHIVSGTTSNNDEHRHEFLFITQIDAPLV